MKRILTLLLVVALGSVAIAEDPVVEDHCLAMIRDEAGHVQRLALPHFSVLEETKSAAAFALPANVATKPEGLMCVRSSAVPALNDYKVVDAGIPFYISTDEADDARKVVVLEISGGQFRARLLKGELSDSESQALGQRLDQYQIAIQKSGSRPK